jgi:hemin uptake protein HemP
VGEETNTTPGPAANAESSADDARATRKIASRELFNGAREVVIDHHGRTYFLRITQNGKLILTA